MPRPPFDIQIDNRRRLLCEFRAERAPFMGTSLLGDSGHPFQPVGKPPRFFFFPGVDMMACDGS